MLECSLKICLANKQNIIPSAAARSMHRAAGWDLRKPVLLRIDALAHGEQLPHNVVVYEQHCVSSRVGALVASRLR